MLDQKMTIFYTDDDEEDLEFFKEVTDTIEKDLNLVTHNNGKKLLEALDNPPPTPHVLFLDLNMPGLNGFDVLERVRQKEELKKIPIIIFSTSSDSSIIRKSRAMGADYFVTKSGSFPVLRKSIEHALSIDWSRFTASEENFVYSA